METIVRNQVFGRLWDQAGSVRFDRHVDRAQNGQGRRAIKFKTDGFCKVLILEANHRPGFEVRLFGFPETPGLVNAEGAVTFANPVEAAELQALIRQIDRWTISFETIFGERIAGLPLNAASRDSAGDATDSETTGTTDDSETRSEENEQGEMSSCQTNCDNWDQEDAVAATSDRA